MGGPRLVPAALEETPPPPPRPLRPHRVVAAALVSLLFIGTSLAYHDGFLGRDAIADAQTEGLYRFKGRVLDMEEGVAFTLDDGSAAAKLHWNATRVSPGAHVVVDVERRADGSLRALSVSPVFLRWGR